MTITLTMRMIVAAFLICNSLKLGLNCYEIAIMAPTIMKIGADGEALEGAS